MSSTNVSLIYCSEGAHEVLIFGIFFATRDSLKYKNLFLCILFFTVKVFLLLQTRKVSVNGVCWYRISFDWGGDIDRHKGNYEDLCQRLLSSSCRLFLSRGADIDIMNREGDTPLTLARPETPVWVALQINRKLRRGITNRMLRTERIICR